MKLDKIAIKSLWNFVAPYKKPAFASTFLVTVTVVLGLIPPLLYKQVIDNGIKDANEEKLLLYCLCVVAVVFASAFVQMAEEFASCMFGLVMMNDVRNKLYAHLQQVPIAFFHETSAGAIISRFTSDLLNVQKAVARTIPSVLTNVLMLAFSLGIMSYLSWELTIITLITLPLYSLISVRISKTISKIAEKAVQLGDKMMTMLGEDFSIEGLLFFKLAGVEGYRRRNFETLTGEIQSMRLRLSMWARTNSVTTEVIQLLSVSVIYFIGGKLSLSSSLSLGTIVAFVTMANRLYQPIIFFSSSAIDLPTSLISVERIRSFLDTPLADRNLCSEEEALRPELVEYSIVFDRVSFKYPGSEQGLDSVSFSVKRGERISIVGANGAGKTTVLMLLAGIYKPSAGNIYLCGRDVTLLTREEIAKLLGVAAGQGFFLNASIQENLAVIKPDATGKIFSEALQRSGSSDFLNALPEGIDTKIGQAGTKLSAGQRQRLALARLYLADPEVMCLDESTANIDAETEEAIIATLQQLDSAKTVVVISHSLKTARWAPRLLILEDGRLVADGNHVELSASSAQYRKLFMNTEFHRELAEGTK